MGLPVGYTQMCMTKNQRKSIEYNDKRLSLIGNGWSVPVVAWFLGQLVGTRGLGPRLTPKEVMTRLKLEGNPCIQSRLMRPPLRIDQTRSGVPEQALIKQLAGLVSTKVKGADLMLNSTPDEIQGHQRLRHTVNPNDVAMESHFGLEMARTPGTHQLIGTTCLFSMPQVAIGAPPKP